MLFVQAFKMAIKSILGKKGRSLLTMLSIAIGVMAVIAIVSLEQAKSEKDREDFLKMGTNRIDVYCSIWTGGGAKDISDDIYDYCLSLTDLVEGVTPSMPMWDVRVKYQAKSLMAQVYMGSDQYTVCNNDTVEKGRNLAYMDIQRRNRVCLIGSAVVNRFFNYKNPIGETIFINNERFTVVGTLKQKYDNSEYSEDGKIVIPYSLNRTMNKNMAIEQFIVKARDGASTSRAIDKLKIFLLSKTKDYPNSAWFNVNSQNEWMEESDKLAQSELIFMAVIAAISLLVAGIGIMNIMLVTVKERTREIGVRKAIGAQRSSIVSQFLMESGILSALAGALGLILGILATMVLVKVQIDRVFTPTPLIMLLAFGVSVLLGMLFGLYPAIKASGLQPVEALRNE